MTEDELLEHLLRIVQEGNLVLASLKYNQLTDKHDFHLIVKCAPERLGVDMHRLPRPVLAALLRLVKSNDSLVCSSPEQHKASWHEAYIEFFDDTIIVCDDCAEMRRNNHHIP